MAAVRFGLLLLIGMCGIAFRVTEQYWVLVAYWLMFLVFGLSWTLAMWSAGRVVAVCGWIVSLVGGILNGLPVLANGGMPVPDEDFKALGPWWKKVSECEYFLALGDNYWGSSIGDFVLLAALGLLTGEIVHRACKKARASA